MAIKTQQINFSQILSHSKTPAAKRIDITENLRKDSQTIKNSTLNSTLQFIIAIKHRSQMHLIHSYIHSVLNYKDVDQFL